MLICRQVLQPPGGGGGDTVGIFGWECAAGTLEPLAYKRASSAEFSELLAWLLQI